MSNRNLIPVANDQRLIDYIKKSKGKNLPYTMYRDFKETLCSGFYFEDYEDSIYVASLSTTELDDELIDKCVAFLEKLKKTRGFKSKPTPIDAMIYDQNIINYAEEDDDIYAIEPHEFESKPNSELNMNEVAEVIFDYYTEIFGSHAAYLPKTESNFISILTVFSLEDVRKIFTYIRRTWDSEIIKNIKPGLFDKESMLTYSQQSKDIVKPKMTKQTKHAIYYNKQIEVLYSAMGNQKPTSKPQLAYISLVKKIGNNNMALGKKPFDYVEFLSLINTVGGVSAVYENAVLKVLHSERINFVSNILKSILKEFRKHE